VNQNVTQHTIGEVVRVNKAIRITRITDESRIVGISFALEINGTVDEASAIGGVSRNQSTCAVGLADWQEALIRRCATGRVIGVAGIRLALHTGIGEACFNLSISSAVGSVEFTECVAGAIGEGCTTLSWIGDTYTILATIFTTAVTRRGSVACNRADNRLEETIHSTRVVDGVDVVNTSSQIGFKHLNLETVAKVCV